jgi:methylenetetrahydrofolate--tRNA-(uracil-5-)-methyltransferase
VGSTASGWLAGVNAARALSGRPLAAFPPTTMLGALLYYISASPDTPFQPMKPNFGIMPPLDAPIRHKRDRYAGFSERALRDMEAAVAAQELLGDLDDEPAIPGI